MVKQTKSFKKGCIAKKSLAAILAASMVMTSSSMVFAAPVEEVAVEEAAPVVQAGATSAEELVAVSDITSLAIDDIDDQTYTGKEIKPTLTVKKNGTTTTVDAADYTANYSANINVGTATVTVKAVGTNVEASKTFKITPANLSGAAVSVKDIAYIYTGSVVYPTINSVVIGTGDSAITVPADSYEVTPGDAVSTNLTSAGTQTLTVTAKEGGNFTGSATTTYEIQKATLKASDVTITTKKVPYGTALTAADVTVTETATGRPLGSTEYDVKVKNANGELEALSANATTGTHDFYVVTNASTSNFVVGTAIASTYEVVSPSLQTKVDAANLTTGGLGNTMTDYEKNGDVYQVEYDADLDRWPTIVKIADGLEVDKNFKVTTTKTEWKKVGTYTMNLEGINDYPGAAATINFEILQKAITDADIDITANYSQTHAGNNTEPVVSVKDGETDLVEGTDYTVSVAADKKTVTVTGIGNYTGTTAKLPVTYEKLDLDSDVITTTVAGTYAYTGSQVKVLLKDITLVEKDTTPYTLVYGTDYTIATANNNSTSADTSDDYVMVGPAAGEQTIAIVGAGNYAGSVNAKLTIVGTEFSSVFSIDPMEDVKLTGSNLKTTIDGAVKVRYKETGATYNSSNYDIKIYASDDTDLKTALTTVDKTGTYKVVVSPKSSTAAKQYMGTLETSVNVIGKSIVGATISAIKDQEYTGKAIEPTFTVTLSSQLVKDTDYKVTYSNNIKSGIATVVVEGIGQYSGKVVTTFNIVGQMDQEIEFLSAQVKDIASRTLDSKATTAKYNTDKAPQTEATYTSSNPEVATVDAKTGAIAYVGVGTTEITVKAAESDIYKEGTATMTINVLCRQPKNMTATVSGKKITVKADEVKEATKYQIYIKKNGCKAKYVNVDSTGDLSKVYTVKSTGKFTVKVRAFKPDGAGKNYLGAWSTSKVVTVK